MKQEDDTEFIARLDYIHGQAVAALGQLDLGNADRARAILRDIADEADLDPLGQDKEFDAAT